MDANDYFKFPLRSPRLCVRIFEAVFFYAGLAGTDKTREGKPKESIGGGKVVLNSRMVSYEAKPAVYTECPPRNSGIGCGGACIAAS